jgi:hypothetical protein
MPWIEVVAVIGYSRAAIRERPAGWLEQKIIIFRQSTVPLKLLLVRTVPTHERISDGRYGTSCEDNEPHGLLKAESTAFCQARRQPGRRWTYRSWDRTGSRLR